MGTLLSPRAAPGVTTVRTGRPSPCGALRDHSSTNVSWYADGSVPRGLHHPDRSLIFAGRNRTDCHRCKGAAPVTDGMAGEGAEHRFQAVGEAAFLDLIVQREEDVLMNLGGTVGGDVTPPQLLPDQPGVLGVDGLERGS